MSKNGVLLFVLTIVVLISISVTFYRTIIQQDFEVLDVEVLSEEVPEG